MDNRKMQIVIMAGLIVFGGLHIVQTAKAGEAPEIEWQKTYGDQSSIASFNDVVQTSDGGLILLGNQQEKLWLVKTDSLGDELWSKTYEMESNNGPNHGFQVCECSDKGYAIGCVEYANNGYNLILIKTNSNGVELWRKIIYEGLDYWRDYEFQQCFDKGFIFITTFMEVGEDPYYSIPRAILIKTDQNGNTQWIKIYDPYGLKGSTEGHSVKQTDDKGFIFLVTKNEYEHGVTSVDNDIMLVKTDSNGNPLWSEPAGIELSDEGIKLHKTIDNGYVILGRYFGWSAGDPDVLLLIKTDESGQQEWLKYLSMEEILFGYDCIQTQDEGYIITGITGDSNYYSYAYLIKIDKNGEKEWDNIFGNSDVRKNLANSVIQVSDGGFVLAGAIFETESPYSKGWLIKLKPDGDGAPDNEKILDYEKAMYVWGESSDILDNKNDEYNIDELISFCKESEHQINTLYFYVNEDLLNHPNLPTLISKAKENDIEVHALAPGKDYLNLWGGDAPNEYHDNVYLDWVN